ncbi:MAG: serine/threonine protein kinase [Acidobacteria bacterium]|nr:MAG: serine/threonine protein kinase [Acidobacteriota bacterium]
MSGERDRRLQELLAALLDVPEEDRERELQRIETDPELAAEAARLLASEQLSFLGAPAVGALARDAAATQEGYRASSTDDHELLEFPDYTVERLLGEGGMGRVFLARQKSAGGRAVALKIIRGTLLSRDLERRFTVEQQALARLNHPAIAQLYASGTTTDGRPFVAMEFVDGVPITRWCDERGLGVRQRIELFVAICRGVEHAHRRQLLHRDLKPSNLLITERDGAATPKIIDFGIARTLEAAEGATALTGTELLGTPAYMSPEAIRPSEGPRDLDTRTDVYSLGVVLYELLLGVRPFDGDTQTDALSLIQRIASEDAPTLQRRWKDLDEIRRTDRASTLGLQPAEVHRAFSGELSWILERAISSEREARYGSVAALADDLERHLADEPIAAGPPSLRYRTGKFVRRHRLPVAAAAVAVLSLVAAVVASTLALQQARSAAREEAEARRDAETALGFLSRIFQSSAVNQQGVRRNPEEVTARDLLDQGAARIEQELGDRPLQAADLRRTLAASYRNLDVRDAARELLLDSQAALEAEPPSPAVKQRLARVHIELSQLADSESRNDEALDHLYRAEELLAGSDVTKTERTLLTAQILDRRATAKMRQARYDEAERLAREAIRLCESDPAIPLDQTLGRISNLGTIFFQQERWQEAEQHQRRAAEMARRVLGSEHTRTARIVDSLAAAIASQGRLDEAAPLFAESFEIRQAILPEDHPDLAISLNNQGQLATDRGRYAEAEDFHRRALAIRTQSFGPVHPTTAWSWQALAGALEKQGRGGEAVAALRSAVEILRQRLRPDHPRLLGTQKLLDEMETRVGRE